MMNGKNSYETSWADQWDPEPMAYNSHQESGKKKLGSNDGGAKKKVEEGLVKTKEVATVGMKKVKKGATVGFHWIKDKYHKTTNKN